MVNDYSFGSPAEGVKWLVSQAKKHGLWSDGNTQRLLSLGTCGVALPGKAGNYNIDFGPLGKISFTVV